MFASFLAGMVTFLAPCTFPLIPAYLGFLAGDRKPTVRTMLANGAGFMVGFSLIFILLGVFATSMATMVSPAVRSGITRLAGFVILLWGLDMVGVFQGVRARFAWNPRWKGLQSGRWGSSVALGGMLAVGWSPCIGPILGTILTIVWNSANVWDGVLLMTVFSAGFAVPFLGVAALMGLGYSQMENMQIVTVWVQRISGVLLIGVGVLFFLDGMEGFIAWVFRNTRFIDYRGILEWL